MLDMKVKALLDTNILLDFFQARIPFYADAQAVWDQITNKKFDGYVTGVTIVNVFYIVEKASGIVEARKAVKATLDICGVCFVDKSVVDTAYASSITDYEDAVQHAAAEASGIDIIVTRNVRDYKNATLKIMTPADFLKTLP
jgi:predicted nucleic acid-binding protein